MAAGGFVAEHRAGGDQGGRLLAQPAQPGFDRGGDADGPLAEPFQSLDRDRSVGLAQQRGDLRNQQRIAAGQPGACRGGVLVGRPGAARFQELADAGRAEPADPHHLGGRFAAQFGDRVGVRRLLTESHRHHQGDSRAPGAARDRRQRFQARRVDPVAVIDEEGERHVGRRALADPGEGGGGERRDSVTRVRPVAARIDDLGETFGQLALLDPAVEERLQQLERKAERGGALQR